jgi:DNA-binding response OmpR family regulator
MPPLMNGRELADRFRALRPSAPGLFASGHEVSSFREPGSPVITKPFPVEELTRRVREALARRSPLERAPRKRS